MEMKASLTTIMVLLFSVVVNVSSQFLIKHGTAQRSFLMDFGRPVDSIISVFTNPFILGGIFCAIISMAAWLYVVSRTDLSIAFPIANAIAFFAIAFFAQFLFGETMTLIRWIGLGLIAGGIYLASQ